MKWLVAGLLAANLALAAYWLLNERIAGTDAQLPDQQLNAAQIRIIAAPTPRPPAPVAAPVAGTCVEWGNFTAATLPAAQAAVEGLGMGERAQRIDVAVTTGYWLYIPPLRSKAEMERKGGELRQLGVTEYFPILEPGRWRYAISLGAFRDEDGAKAALAALRAKGVRSARLGSREQRVMLAAFMLRDPSEEQAAQLAGLIKAQFPGTQAQPLPCPPS